MAAKVNLKKYLAILDKWQFVPVLKMNGKKLAYALQPSKGRLGDAGLVERQDDGKELATWKERDKPELPLLQRMRNSDLNSRVR